MTPGNEQDRGRRAAGRAGLRGRTGRARDLDTALLDHPQRNAHPARAYSIGASRRSPYRDRWSSRAAPGKGSRQPEHLGAARIETREVGRAISIRPCLITLSATPTRHGPTRSARVARTGEFIDRADRRMIEWNYPIRAISAVACALRPDPAQPRRIIRQEETRWTRDRFRSWPVSRSMAPPC